MHSKEGAAHVFLQQIGLPLAVVCAQDMDRQSRPRSAVGRVGRSVPFAQPELAAPPRIDPAAVRARMLRHADKHRQAHAAGPAPHAAFAGGQQHVERRV